MTNYENNNDNTFQQLILRYVSFWPYFLISIIISLALAFIYLRYAKYEYNSFSKIEIIDKAQDSDMSLPTSMTIFNRSMINLGNEIGVLTSHKIHESVVKELSSNIKYFTSGKFKTSENHIEEWIPNSRIVFNVESNQLKNSLGTFEIIHTNDGIRIIHKKNREILEEYYFKSKSTFDSSHNLPFDIDLNKSEVFETTKMIEFNSVDLAILNFKNRVIVNESSVDSDQLILEMTGSNRKISEEYLNVLMTVFDNDGIVDRQLEYKRTMDFVDSRSDFLSQELLMVENKRQKFKEENYLTDIDSDAELNASQQISYDSELFNAYSQRDLLLILENDINENKDDFNLLPVNIGIENNSINELISNYNILVSQLNQYSISIGQNSTLIINLKNQIENYSKNIDFSIQNYKDVLSKKISNLEIKEREFYNTYKNIPEKEKILRSIERELEIKESLFILLLQKREEAAINYAVVKPSIKIIDYARSTLNPISPIKSQTYLISLVFGLFIPFTVIYIWFYFDTKIHTKSQLIDLVNAPVIAEIPFIQSNDELNTISSKESRSTLSESIRMLVANLNFIVMNNKKENNILLVTSTVKGEGKTIVSTNLASHLSYKNQKVLLIGTDLRNPQIHKLLNLDRDNIKGVTEYICSDQYNWEDLVFKNDNLDVLLSGAIPPNPTELLSSTKFKKLLDNARLKYDFVVIDSAPCLLVSDTFEISKHVDNTVYVVRSNYTEKKLSSYINEIMSESRIKNLNLVLNGVGNSSAYGYKYGYQYGYRYGYRYNYNYGYGYGYKKNS